MSDAAYGLLVKLRRSKCHCFNFCVVLLSVVLTAFVIVFYADFVYFLYTALFVVVFILILFLF